MESKTKITVQANVAAPIEKVWESWKNPKHVMNWNNASDDWHTPYAENDFRVGGQFKATMAAKDGSMSFDFVGTNTAIKTHELIEYEIADGRKVSITFEKAGKNVLVTETFEAEDENPIEMQRGGWQAILDNFKKYTETLK